MIGRLTSCAYGYTARRMVALAKLPAALQTGAGVEVELFGDVVPALVEPDALYDPHGDATVADGATRAIVLDFNGTLAQDDHLVAPLYVRGFAAAGAELSVEQYRLSSRRCRTTSPSRGDPSRRSAVRSPLSAMHSSPRGVRGTGAPGRRTHRSPSTRVR